MKKLKMFTSLIQPRNIDYLKLKSLTINIDGWSVELVETGNKDYCNEKIAIFVPGCSYKDSLSVVDITEDPRTFEELAELLRTAGKDTVKVWPVEEYDIVQYCKFRSQTPHTRNLQCDNLPLLPTPLMRRLSTLKTRDRLPVMGGVIGRDDAVTDFYDEFSGWRKTPWKGICYVSSKTRDITFTIKDNVIRMHPFNMTLMTNYMSNDDYDTLRYTKEVTVDKTMKHMCLQLIAMTSLATIRNKK